MESAEISTATTARRMGQTPAICNTYFSWRGDKLQSEGREETNTKTHKSSFKDSFYFLLLKAKPHGRDCLFFFKLADSFLNYKSNSRIQTITININAFFFFFLPCRRSHCKLESLANRLDFFIKTFKRWSLSDQAV